MSTRFQAAQSATGDSDEARLTATFGALADPTRRAILAQLARGEASVTDLARPFAMSMPAVSKHLRVLERAGLVACGRNAQWRPRRLEVRALAEAAAWLDEYRTFWSARFDRLEAHLAESPSTAVRDDQPQSSTEQP